MTQLSQNETPATEAEVQARKSFYFLDDINEFARLLNLGMFPGKERKSVDKMHNYLADLWKETIKKVESNEWYISEKEAMKKLKMKELMVGGSGEYNPDYEISMPDVFRKQAK